MDQKPEAMAEDPRIAVLERERGAPLTPEQRQHLPEELKGVDTGAAALRAFALQDGGSEPATIFLPLSLLQARETQKAKP